MSSDDMASHVKDALARVSFKTDRADPQGAALQFFTDVMTELRRNRVSHDVTDASKALISQLMPKLEPAVVRETIKSAHEHWSTEVKHDFHHFMRKVTDTSIEAAKYSAKRTKDDVISNPDTVPFNKKQKRYEKSGDGSHQHTPRKATDKPDSDRRGNSSKSVEWTLPCLNHKCDKCRSKAKLSLVSKQRL